LIIEINQAGAVYLAIINRLQEIRILILPMNKSLSIINDTGIITVSLFDYLIEWDFSSIWVYFRLIGNNSEGSIE